MHALKELYTPHIHFQYGKSEWKMYLLQKVLLLLFMLYLNTCINAQTNKPFLKDSSPRIDISPVHCSVHFRSRVCLIHNTIAEFQGQKEFHPIDVCVALGSSTEYIKDVLPQREKGVGLPVLCPQMQEYIGKRACQDNIETECME